VMYQGGLMCVNSIVTMSVYSVLQGGFSIQEEMCVNYIHYYPRCDLEVCKSSISDLDLNRFFKLANA
jgi:dopamine beta-monooxygenase